MSLQIIEQIVTTEWAKFMLEPLEARDSSCECCGSVTRTVWGNLDDESGTVAAYYVTWTPGKPDHRASFDLIVGSWGEGTDHTDRCGISLEYSSSGDPAGLRVLEEVKPDVANSDLVGFSLGRDQIIGTAAAAKVFAMVDAIFMNEPRIEEVRKWG